MTLTSPILAAITLPIVIAILLLMRRVNVRSARWMIRAAAIFLLLGIAGIDVRCDRPLNIAVLVDVSPSTREATFRDPASVTARLGPLLNGKPYTLHYFGDGLQTNADESPIEKTRLEIPAHADAVVLMSDGRFEAPADLPPIYPVIDPDLDHPGDGRIDELRADNDRVLVNATIDGPARSLRLSRASPSTILLASGKPVVQARADAKATSVTATLDGGDRWPENDSLTLLTLPAISTNRWAVGTNVPNFTSLAASRLPTDLSAYVNTSVVVLSTDARISDSAATATRQYVEQLGGTLICVGPSSALPVTLRDIAPLSSAPPNPTSDWTILLDASGSMGETEFNGQSRWQIALDAAARAVGRLSADVRVSVITFARSTNTIVTRATPAAAIDAIKQLANRQPTGPTGLRPALDAIAAANRPTRLLLLTDADADVGDANALAARLRGSHVQLFALTTTESKLIDDLTTATGGRTLVCATPSDWSNAMESLATTASTPLQHQTAIATVGHGPITGMPVHLSTWWQSWMKDHAELLAETDGVPLIATWQRGSGRVVSVTGTLRDAEVASIAMKLEQPAADPRYSVTWDEAHDTVRLHAIDQSFPMNGLYPTLLRGDSVTPLTQTAPGEYEAALPRRSATSAAVIRVDGVVVARRAIAGRYVHEFDRIGNDLPVLRALAERTGGAVIEAGDAHPIAFAHPTILRSTTSAWAIVSAGLLCGAILIARRGQQS